MKLSHVYFIFVAAVALLASDALARPKGESTKKNRALGDGSGSGNCVKMEEDYVPKSKEPTKVGHVDAKPKVKSKGKSKGKLKGVLKGKSKLKSKGSTKATTSEKSTSDSNRHYRRVLKKKLANKD
eukprot:scaffold22095_cov71-Attheya_sp.AAC.6